MEDNYRPYIGTSDILIFLEENLGLKVLKVEELRAFEDRNFLVELVNELKSNLDIIAIEHDKIIVKIVKWTKEKSIKWNLLKNITFNLDQNGFICTQIKSIDDFHKNGNDFLVLTLRYIPGTPLMDCWSVLDRTSVICHIGELVAYLHNNLQALDTSILLDEDCESPWKLENAKIMLEYLHVVKESKTREVIKTVINSFISKSAYVKSSLKTGIIHGDLSDLNLIVNCVEGKLQPITDKSSKTARDLFGIIDFGDMCVSCYIYEVGQIIRDIMVSTYPDVPNCYDITVIFLLGYLKHRKLIEQEINILFITIMVSLCQYYVIGEYEFLRQKDNAYTKMGAEESCNLILKYHESETDFTQQIFKHITINYNS